MAIDPSDLVTQAGGGTSLPPPPDLLARAPGTAPPLSPLRGEGGDEALARLHAAWARLHAGGTERPGRADPAAAERLRAGARRALGRLDAATHGAERALIGETIRAVDALAGRCDELSGRLTELDLLVEEVVTVFSQELAALRAALDPAAGGPGHRAAPG